MLLNSGAAQAQQAPMVSPPPGWVWQGTWHDGQWSGQWVPAAPGMAAGGPGPQYAPYAPSAPQGLGGYGPMGTDDHTEHMIRRCRNYRHDSVAGGAVIGGVAGAVVGNRVARGDRLLGTVGGAAVGAAAGAAIDSGIKHGRDRECEAFFGEHPEYAPGAQGAPGAYQVPPYGPQGYGMPGPMGNVPPGYMMVPVPQAQAAPCVETRTTTTTYIDEPRHRLIRARPHRAPPHRKEKRVYTGS